MLKPREIPKNLADAVMGSCARAAEEGVTRPPQPGWRGGLGGLAAFGLLSTAGSALARTSGFQGTDLARASLRRRSSGSLLIGRAVVGAPAPVLLR